jgi:hypothetical protein
MVLHNLRIPAFAQCGASSSCVCRVVIAIGLSLHFLGHFGLWLAATGRINLSYLQVCCCVMFTLVMVIAL